mgnify:CR=1 FL=1
MSKDIGKLKLEELFFLAKHINYIKPDKDYSNWTEDEKLYYAIYSAVNNKAQVDILYGACEVCPPVKPLMKERLKLFITKFEKI